MPAERREQVIAFEIGSTGNGRNLIFNGRRQPSSDGTSRMTRECQVRICERLGVKLLGPTRQRHPLWVLTVGYPGGRTRQFSLRPEQVPDVRRWLDNYQTLRQGLEAICELNHELLHADKDASKARSKSRD